MELRIYRNLKYCKYFGLVLIVVTVYVTTKYLDPMSTHTRMYNTRNKKGSDVIKPEVHHVVFLKVHKAASSTMLNIFMRFGMSRDLNVMVPRKRNLFSQRDILRPSQFLHYSRNGLYDILCCHVIYNKAAMRPYFPQDTRYIGIVRDPFQQFLSAFQYYRTVYHLSYLMAIPGENPVLTYLQDPRKYEPKSPKNSFTNNRMALDFGYPADQFDDISYMHVYLKQLMSELDFVIIVEYFDESLILLKRLLGWQLQDILYIPRKYGKRDHSLKFTKSDEELYRKWAKLDYILYEKFLDVFKQKLENQGESFYDELDTFRLVQNKMASFCSDTEARELLVSESRWSWSFTVTRQDCDYMQMKAPTLIDFVRERYTNVNVHLKDK